MAEWIIWTDEADHPLKLEIKPPGNITKLKTHHPVLLPNDPREQILVLTQIAAGMGVKITALETPEWVPDIGDKVVAGASRGEITAVGRTFALILWQGRSEEEGKVKREVLRLDHEFYGQDLVQALPDEQLPIDPRGGGDGGIDFSFIPKLDEAHPAEAFTWKHLGKNLAKAAGEAGVTYDQWKNAWKKGNN